ncbi:UTP6.2 family protein [Megaselia abdita]
MRTYSTYISFLNALKNGFDKSKKVNMEKVNSLVRTSDEFKTISKIIQDLTKIIKKIVDILYVLYIDMCKKKFPFESRCWENFITFLKTNHFHDELVDIYFQYFKNFKKNAEVLVEAMKWAFTKKNDMNLVKQFFTDVGVKNFFTKTPIFTTYLSFLYEKMLHIIDDLEKQDAPKELVLEKLVSDTKEVIKVIKAGPVKQFDYLEAVLSQSEDFKHYFTIPIQAEIIKIMQAEFPTSEEFFNLLALREMRGLNRCDLEGNDGIDVMRNGYKKRSRRKCINLGFLTFEKSYEMFKNNKIWYYFLDALPSIQEVDSKDQPITWKTFQEFKQSSMRYKVWKKSVDRKIIKECHLIDYVAQLIEIDSSNEEVLEIFEFGAQHYPTSIKLWEYYMVYYQNNDNVDGFVQTFYRGAEKLQAESLPLWKKVIEYLFLCYEKKYHLRDVLSLACKQTHSDFLHFRIKTLEYVFYQYGLDKARLVFQNLTKLHPPYKPLLDRMLEFEKKNVNCDRDKIVDVYEKLIEHFGDDNVEIWIDYLAYASTLTEEKDNKLFQQIVGRARVTLKGESLSNFETQWKHIDHPKVTAMVE